VSRGLQIQDIGGKWEEARGKSTTKGQRQSIGKDIIPIANEFNPLHDHDTRHATDKGKGLGGAAKAIGKGNVPAPPHK